TLVPIASTRGLFGSLASSSSVGCSGSTALMALTRVSTGGSWWGGCSGGGAGGGLAGGGWLGLARGGSFRAAAWPDGALGQVARPPVVLLPLGVGLGEDAHLAVGLGQVRVGAAGAGQVVQELHDVRVGRAVDRRVAEAGERHDKAVELAAPVVHAIVAGVGDE